MKDNFVQTKNHRRTVAMLEELRNRGQGVPGLGLIYSEPGLGKTTSIAWCAVNMADVVVIRAKAVMSARWLLEELVSELGEAPMRRVIDLYRQAVDRLLEDRRMVMVDEVDHLTHDGRVIETLRDLHDITGAPVVFVGMGHVDKKIARYPHLYNRISQVVKFIPLDESDIALAARELCELELEPGALKVLAERTSGKFRNVMLILDKVERAARKAGLNIIDSRFMETFQYMRAR
jgi:DNA transposition AAA+ family ATPase